MSSAANGNPVGTAAGVLDAVDAPDADEPMDETEGPPEAMEAGGTTPGDVETVEFGVVNADPQAANRTKAASRIDACLR